MTASQIICTRCAAVAAPLDWRCTSCGGPLDLAMTPRFDAGAINAGDFSLWRYSAMLPVERHVTLGEGMTPLVQTTINGNAFYAKLEYLNPTGSYKDRGTVMVMNHMAAHKAQTVVEDSSGNAGASVAAYSSALGIRSRIFVPASAAPAKKALIAVMGGELVEIEGPQHAKTEACERAAETTPYASHAWSPYFVLGQMTAAWELWEQLGQRAPDAVVSPVGHGCLFLGFARGFRMLYEAGLIEQMPRLFAVQSERSDPIVRGWEAGDAAPPRVQTQQTAADGIIVDIPVRGDEVLAALRGSDGAALRVPEASILPARDAAAACGFIIEPTSAVTIAALPQVRDYTGSDATIVCAFTGNGLKYVGR